MVIVKVVYQSTGKPAKDRKVALYVSKFLASGVTNSEYTDSNGEAHFDVESTDGEVYVDGSTKHKGRLAGRVVVYI
jgi:5-hydroxyisourate hydrolase-like protein (transthyretin family)